MAVHTATPKLSDEVYQQAQHVAQATHRPLEDIVCEWIRPPVRVTLLELERLSDDELLQAARETLPPERAHRLQELLAAQRR